MGGALHPRRPGDDPTGALPLVVVPGPRRHQCHHVGRFDQCGPDHRDVEADVDHRDLTTVLRPLSEQVARLEGGERDRPLSSHRGTQFTTGQPVDPGREVDGQYGGVGGGCRIGAAQAGAVRGVHHQVGGGEFGGRRFGVEHQDLHPEVLQPVSGHATVGAVGSRTGDHHDPATVGAAQHVDRCAGNGSTGTADEHVVRLGGGGIDRRHLLGCGDRQHSLSVPRPRPGRPCRCARS